MQVSNIKSLSNVFVVELCMFFLFMIAGIGIDNLLPAYKEDDTKLKNLLLIFATVFMIVFVSVVARPVIVRSLIGDRKRAAGVGILYAYALLVGQTSFKQRVDRLSKESFTV